MIATRNTSWDCIFFPSLNPLSTVLYLYLFVQFSNTVLLQIQCYDSHHIWLVCVMDCCSERLLLSTTKISMEKSN